jgi:hypothetical protein
MIRLLLLFCLLLPGLHAQQCQRDVGIPTLPRIQGYIQDLDQNPISDVKLEMVRVNPDGSPAEIVETRTTDAKGYFRFKRSKDQIYRVNVHIPDRKIEPLVIRQGGVVMRTGGGLMNFLFLVDKTPCISIQLTR